MKEIQESYIVKGNTQNLIAQTLDELLGASSIKRVYFADSSIAPPPLAYVTSFPRLAVPLWGRYPVETAHGGKVKVIDCKTGEAVFVARHCWDKPKWAEPVKVLTVLFGKKQIGFSLVAHDGSTQEPVGAAKASIPSTKDDLPQNILSSIISLNEPDARLSIGPLLVEALLHACLRILKKPEAMQARRANHTYDAICLFVQEHYQQPLARHFVAERFGLHPSHVSRLFRDEGNMRFTDYINLVRIERAKFLLKNYDMPLKEIAASCGFSDTAYFCRVFRMMTKITPTAYRLWGL